MLVSLCIQVGDNKMFRTSLFIPNTEILKNLSWISHKIVETTEVFKAAIYKQKSADTQKSEYFADTPSTQKVQMILVFHSVTYMFFCIVNHRWWKGMRPLSISDLMRNLIAFWQTIDKILLVFDEPQPHVNLKFDLDCPPTRPHASFSR